MTFGETFMIYLLLAVITSPVWGSMVAFLYRKVYQKIHGHDQHKVCPECNSLNMEHNSNWTRGYNDWCTQASGDSGSRCYDCGHITWEKTRNEYDAILPNWCRSFEDGEKTSIQSLT